VAGCTLRLIRREHYCLLAVWAVLALLGYLWENVHLPQFEGRHLFPALVVWGLGYTLGLRKLFHSTPLPILALLATSIVVLFAYSIATGNYLGFDITALALTMVIIGVGHWLQSRTPSTPLVLATMSLVILAIACLFSYIIPAPVLGPQAVGRQLPFPLSASASLSPTRHAATTN